MYASFQQIFNVCEVGQTTGRLLNPYPNRSEKKKNPWDRSRFPSIHELCN